MHRYDKYDPISGGFRVPLAQAWPATGRNLAQSYGVGLNGSGQVVVGDGTTGVIGVMVVDVAKAAGEMVDVMTGGEVGNYENHDNNSDASAPGESVTADGTTGVLSAAGAGDSRIGVVVAGPAGKRRLVVRVPLQAIPEVETP